MAKKTFKILIIILLIFSYRGYASSDISLTAYAISVESQIFPDDSIKVVEPKGKKEKKKDGQQRGTSKKVTFETFDQNYAKALKYYNNSQYISAARLFEELYPLSMGSPLSDTLLFLFADCYYKNKDYELAAFHFKDYCRRFPNTSRTEDAHYLCVRSIYNVSPLYSLDQSSTLYAIDEINLFIQNYPQSKYAEECNSLLDNLREKLSRKEFETIKLYYNTDHYEAAQIATKNYLKEYSYTKLAAEAVYTLIKNNFEYAKKSINSKQEERYRACIDAFDLMKANYSDSPFFAESEKIAKDALTQIEKIKNKRK